MRTTEDGAAFSTKTGLLQASSIKYELKGGDQCELPWCPRVVSSTCQNPLGVDEPQRNNPNKILNEILRYCYDKLRRVFCFCFVFWSITGLVICAIWSCALRGVRSLALSRTSDGFSLYAPRYTGVARPGPRWTNNKSATPLLLLDNAIYT